MDGLKRWCELFAALGIGAGVLHTGGDGLADAGREPEEIHALRVDALGRISGFVAGGPTSICLENLMPPLPSTLEEMVRLVDAVGGADLALCLDTGHLNVVGGNCADFVRRAGKRLKALHVTDSIDGHDDHLLPHGAGNIDWCEFVDALHESGYEGAFNFEVPRENRCPMEIRLAKLDYARELARAMIGA